MKLDAPGTAVDRVKTVVSLGLPPAVSLAAIDDVTVGALLRWYDAGAGSGSHLAETLGLPLSRNVQHLANVLTCAQQSNDVKRMLAELAE